MKEIEIACRIGSEPSREEIVAAAAKALGVSSKAVGHYRIMRRSWMREMTYFTVTG